jgi:hypothetical protein
VIPLGIPGDITPDRVQSHTGMPERAVRGENVRFLVDRIVDAYGGKPVDAMTGSAFPDG